MTTPTRSHKVWTDEGGHVTPTRTKYRHLCLYTFYATQAKGLKGAADGGKRPGQDVCDALEGAALMVNDKGAL